MQLFLSVIVIIYLLLLYLPIPNSLIGNVLLSNVQAQIEETNNGKSIIIDTAIIVAIIAALASIFGAIFSSIYSARSQKSLDESKKETEDKFAEKQARRDYRYNALKQLYEKCEPVLFQYIELSEQALNAIYKLAEFSRENKSLDLSSITSNNIVLIKYVLYYLFAPLATFKILQDRLTLPDFSSDRSKYFQYSIGKIIYYSFANDLEIAKLDNNTNYDPQMLRISQEIRENIDERKKLEKKSPDKYTRQGLDMETIDIISKEFISGFSEYGVKQEVQRVIDTSEFDRFFFQQKYDPIHDTWEMGFSGPISQVRDLFNNFHPKNKPILWRILIAQAFLYKIMLNISYNEPQSDEGDVSYKTTKRKSEKIQQKEISFEPLNLSFKSLDWRREGDNISYDEVFEIPISSVKEYLRIKLSPVFKQKFREDDFKIPTEIENNLRKKFD